MYLKKGMPCNVQNPCKGSVCFCFFTYLKRNVNILIISLTIIFGQNINKEAVGA